MTLSYSETVTQDAFKRSLLLLVVADSSADASSFSLRMLKYTSRPGDVTLRS